MDQLLILDGLQGELSQRRTQCTRRCIEEKACETEGTRGGMKRFL